MLGFGLFALIQSAIIVLFTVYVLQVRYTGNLLWVFLVTLILALGAVNLGIFLSTYARNELQAIQFMPIVIAPQVFLSGLLWPVKDMPDWLQVVARALPLTYANKALTNIMIRGKGLAETCVADRRPAAVRRADGSAGFADAAARGGVTLCKCRAPALSVI